VVEWTSTRNSERREPSNSTETLYSSKIDGIEVSNLYCRRNHCRFVKSLEDFKARELNMRMVREIVQRKRD
ncbi:unnamed protein product, partial [Amoebophrya sp. A25]